MFTVVVKAQTNPEQVARHEVFTTAQI